MKQLYYIPPPKIEQIEKRSPRSIATDDIYYNTDGGLAESKYVFIDGNNLAFRFQRQSDFVIAELGFGSGLNFVATIDCWLKNRQPTGILTYISFEIAPLSQSQLKTVAKDWPELANIYHALIKNMPKPMTGIYSTYFTEWNTRLILCFGDANDILPTYPFLADAWYLDGFAPAKNPSLWSEKIIKQLKHHSHNTSSLATYCASGAFQRQLKHHDFTITKKKGFGKKREMVNAIASNALPDRPLRTQKSVAIIGAGIAGCSLAYYARMYGHKATIFDSAPHSGSGASGNPTAIVHPYICAGTQYANRLGWAAGQHALNFYRNINIETECFHDVGVKQPLNAATIKKLSAQYGECLQYDEETLQVIYADYGLVIPQILLNHLAQGADTIFDTKVSASELIAKYDIVIEATANHFQHENLSEQHGAISMIKDIKNALPHFVISQKGYLSPSLLNAAPCVGATFTNKALPDTEITHLNGQILTKLSDGKLTDKDIINHRSSMRATTTDHLPICGNTKISKKVIDDIRLGKAKWHSICAEMHGTHFVLSGLGSRGFTNAPILAESIIAQLSHLPSPLNGELNAAVHPARFIAKEAAKG